MQKISRLFLALNFLVLSAFAQVIAPTAIKDPELRELQEQYLDDLTSLGKDILILPREYPFYLSRKLDLDEAQQKQSDQHSIRFDRYKGRTVLEVTGNYYASYSNEKISPGERAKETYLKVILPILKVEVPRFQGVAALKAYAFEISHHVSGKVMGVAIERPENLVVIMPQAAAIRLVGAKDDENVQQSALLQAEVYLNANPVTLWLSGEGPQLAAQGSGEQDSVKPKDSSVEIVHDEPEVEQGREAAAIRTPNLKAEKPPEPPPPPRDTSPSALAGLQAVNEQTLAEIVKKLDPQAHFVSYAPPSFIAFRNQIFAEFSVNSTLTERAAGGSHYQLAALAFDDHISHLIRPVLAYFKGEQQFDGISFSANLHVPGKSTASTGSEAVEFFFPFSALRCYEKYDCTGQQLIDAGAVLISGERVGLDLEVAEGSIGR